MKIRIVSDIHVEHRAFADDKAGTLKAFVEAVPADKDDADSLLLLAGDITSQPSQRKWIIEEVASRFENVIYVPGNHEHYGGYIENWNLYEAGWHGQNNNVRLAHTGKANSCSFMKYGLTVISATMWAPYGEKDPVAEVYLQGTSDVRWINDASAKSLQKLYRAELDGIVEHLQEERISRFDKDGREIRGTTAVVTHHVPSLKLRHPLYPAGPMDDMFMSAEAEEIMHSDYAPDYWFFGHTHRSWDIQIGKTRCISNPFGYPKEPYQGWQKVKAV